MNSHKHARLTFARRLEMVKQMTFQGLDAAQAGTAQGMTAQTARKRLGRYLSGGEAALADASFRPARSPRAIAESKALLIVELRTRRCCSHALPATRVFGLPCQPGPGSCRFVTAERVGACGARVTCPPPAIPT